MHISVFSMASFEGIDISKSIPVCLEMIDLIGKTAVLTKSALFSKRDRFCRKVTIFDVSELLDWMGVGVKK